MKLRKLSAYGIAAIAAASFAMVSPTVLANTHKTKSVKCYGGNSCKGKSACKTAKNSCKGQNSCKGEGFVSASSKAACEKLGGTTTKPRSFLHSSGCSCSMHLPINLMLLKPAMPVRARLRQMLPIKPLLLSKLLLAHSKPLLSPPVMVKINNWFMIRLKSLARSRAGLFF